MPLTAPTRPRRLLVGFLAGGLVLLAGCSSPGGSTGTSTTGAPAGTVSTTTPEEATTGSATSPVTPTTASKPASTAAATAPATDLLRGLDIPWSVVTLPDGSSLVSVRNTGEIHHVPRPGSGGADKVVGTLPMERSTGEGGLLGLAVPVDFDVDPVFYAYYSTADDNRIAAVPWRGDHLGDPVVIFSGIPRGQNHNGGRIAFGPDGFLYVGTGEAGDTDLSQNLESLGGKILRLTPDGKPAPGNPFGGSPIWSYGHRNVQGIAWDKAGRMYASEFGQNTWDELNRIEPGNNYGWPEVEGKAGNSTYTDPLAVWSPADMSPSDITVGPDGAIYLAALRGESVWRVPLAANGSVGTPTRHLEGTYGRIRDIRFVESRAWILTNNGDDDRLVSLPLSAVGATPAG